MGLILLNGTAYSGYDEPPCVYSEEEREIGVWIDGKPLYQKSYHLSSYVALMANTWTTILSVSDLGIDTVTNVEILDQEKVYWTGVLYRIDNGNLQGYSFEGWPVQDITLRYTKSSDTPGSGKWASNGALAKHYSLQEQVIGTWIDGKPLYEKTKEVLFSNLTHEGNCYYTSITSSGETLKYVTGAIANSQSYGIIQLGCTNYASNSNYNNYWELGMYYENICLTFHGTTTATNVNPSGIIITYQYTKTTD